MKILVPVLILLMLFASACTGSKYADEAIPKEKQEIIVDITDMAHEKAEERMKEKGNDELLVMVRGSC
jgi:hypothetical protein